MQDPVAEAQMMYEKGWRKYADSVPYNEETGEIVDATECLYKKNVYKDLEEICFHNDIVALGGILNEYEAVQKLPVVCYHGQFYKDNKPITEVEVRNLVYQMFPMYGLSTIELIVKAARIYKATNVIPPYSFPTCEPKDNGFRFPKEAYQLLHYFLFEPKRKYILTIMSEGNMGKSTFTNFLRYCFKDEYYSADTKSMNQFSASFYASNRLIVFSDCTSKYIEDSHILKQISGGDEVQIEAKGQQAYSATIDSYMLFIGNEPLSYNVLDSGLQNRFINIPWNNNIPKDKRDPKWLNYKWTQEEIAFQIQLAKEAEPLDFETLQSNTIKESLKHKSAFYESNYTKYIENGNIINKYSLETYLEFWKLVRKYYRKNEWQKIVDERDEISYDMWEIQDKKEMDDFSRGIEVF